MRISRVCTQSMTHAIIEIEMEIDGELTAFTVPHTMKVKFWPRHLLVYNCVGPRTPD